MSSYETWDEFLTRYPNVHLLQTGDWGKLKASFGWGVEHVIHGNSGVQILFKNLPFGFTFAYIPKGPVGDDFIHLWPDIDSVCRRRRAIFLKVEPDQWLGPANGIQAPLGFRQSPHSIQPPRTLVVNIEHDENAILSRMKQKTRYNLKLAQKKGVSVQASSDIGTFYRLMHETGGRDQFGIHSLEYYQRAYEVFKRNDSCELLIAEIAKQPMAGLMIFSHGERAWYLFGASSNEHREYMPTYLLQWEAIRWARKRGCKFYDLWGIPDADENTLETEFSKRSDGLWGVYRNKRGYGGILARSAGPWDRIYSNLAYKLYTWWISGQSIMTG